MKNKLTTFLCNTGWYLLPFAIFWLSAGLYLKQYGERNSFLLFNAFHRKVFDHPVLWLTEISGGYIIISIFVLIYARSRPAEALFAAILVFDIWYATITVNYNHFADWKNPAVVFGDSSIHVLGSQQVQPELNFPSSQAAVITGLFLFIAWLHRHARAAMILAAITAMVLIYTRIYAGWAFLGDMLSGSILGIFISIPMITWFLPKTQTWYERRNEWWQKMLVAILRAAAICTLLVNLKYAVL